MPAAEHRTRSQEPRSDSISIKISYRHQEDTLKTSKTATTHEKTSVKHDKPHKKPHKKKRKYPRRTAPTADTII